MIARIRRRLLIRVRFALDLLCSLATRLLQFCFSCRSINCSNTNICHRDRPLVSTAPTIFRMRWKFRSTIAKRQTKNVIVRERARASCVPKLLFYFFVQFCSTHSNSGVRFGFVWRRRHRLTPKSKKKSYGILLRVNERWRWRQIKSKDRKIK